MEIDLHVIVRPGGVGDTLLLAPALASLRREASSRILLVGYEDRLAPLIEAHLADRAISLDSWLADGDLARIEGRPVSTFKTVIDSFYPTLPEGYSQDGMNVRVHPPFPQEGTSVHIALYLAQKLGVRPPKNRTRPLRDLSRERPEREQPTFWIHPGAGGPDKRWPIDSFLEVANQWTSPERGATRFLLGDADRDLEAPILKSGFPIQRPSSIVEIARLFFEGDLFLGNDSGPAHLAALMGLRTLVVFGQTDPSVWGPWGSKAFAVSPNNHQPWPDPMDILICLSQFDRRSE